MRDLGAVVAQGLHWWGSELVALLPSRFRAGTDDGIRRALVRLSPDAMHIRLDQGDFIENLTCPPLEALDGAEANGVSELLQDYDVSLSVPDQHVYRFPLSLPPEARSHVRQAAVYQLATHAPINPSQLLFDLRPNKSGETRTLDFEVAVAKAEYIDDLNRRWTALGLLPPEIGWAEDEADQLAFTFQRIRRSSRYNERTRQARLLAGLGIMVLACPLLIWGAASLWEARVRQDIERLELTLRPKISAQAENARLSSTEEQLSRLLARPHAAAIIEALAKSLPEKAWISRFQMNETELRLTGAGAEGGQATLAVRQSPLLQDAHLQSAADAPDVGGRFEITVPLKAAGQKG